MEPFANVSPALFDPLPEAVAVDATASPAYTTPAGQRVKLRDLARMSYITAEARVTVRLSGSSSGGAGTLKVTDGASELGSTAVDFSAGQHQTFRFPVAVAGVGGEAGLRLELDVTSSADAGITAEVAGSLDVLHPLALVSC